MRSILNEGGGNDEKIEELARINKNVQNELRIKSQKLSSIQQENEGLKDRVKRMTENMKALKYKDLMESKLNVTTDNFNKEIRQLENTLQRYKNDNKRLTMEVSRRFDQTKNFENSMIAGTVDTEKKLLRAQSKNTQLIKELVDAKKKISDLEN
jgi:chromosome segregation ATPase